MAYTGNWATDPASSNFATPELYEGYLQAGGPPMPGSSYVMGDAAPASNYQAVADALASGGPSAAAAVAGPAGGSSDADILAPGFGSKNWAQNPLAGNFATPQAFIDYYKKTGDATGGIQWGQHNDERISPNFSNAIAYQQYLDKGSAPFQLGGKESGPGTLGQLAKMGVLAAGAYFGLPALGEALGGLGAAGAGELAAASLPEFAGTMAGSSGVWGAGGGLLGGAEAAGGLGGLLDASTGVDIASAFGSGTAPFVPAAPAATGLETIGAGGLDSLLTPVLDGAGTTLSDAGLASLVTGTPAATYGPTLANAVSQGLGTGLPATTGLPNVPTGGATTGTGGTTAGTGATTGAGTTGGDPILGDVTATTTPAPVGGQGTSTGWLSDLATTLGMTPEAVTKMFGTGLSTALGLYGSSQTNNLLQKQMDQRQPFIDKALQAVNNPDSWYQSAPAMGATDAVLRKLSINGNPALNPGDLSKASAYNLGGYNNYLNSMGGLAFGNGQTQLAATQAASAATPYNVLAGGLSDILNPKSTTDDLFKQFQQFSNFQKSLSGSGTTLP